MQLKRRAHLLGFALLALGATAPHAFAQVAPDSDDSAALQQGPNPVQALSVYMQPTEADKFHNYLYETFGPYPMLMAASIATYDQGVKDPPEWREGFSAYGRRFGSDFAISAVDISARYAVAEALREDTLYYPSGAKRFFPRLGHALLSTLIAYRGPDGRKVFAFPALAVSYAGPFAAVYGWYPSRYSAKDAFRMGNYGLLEYAGGNILLEFFPTRSRSWIARTHFDNRHAAREIESAP